MGGNNEELSNARAFEHRPCADRKPCPRARRKREFAGLTMNSETRKTVQARERSIVGLLRQLLRANVFDKGAWEKIVAADLHVRIGNAPTVIGKEMAIGELGQFLTRLESIGESFCEVWQKGETVIAETEVQFTDASRRTQSTPCTIVARITAGRLCDLRIHLDPSQIP